MKDYTMGYVRDRMACDARLCVVALSAVVPVVLRYHIADSLLPNHALIGAPLFQPGQCHD